MGKKILSIIILFIISLAFAACESNNDPQSPVSSKAPAETDTENSSDLTIISDEDDEKGFVFMYEGHEIYMGMPEAEIQQLDGYDLVSGNGIPEVIDNRYKFKGFFVECSKWFLSNNAMVVSTIYFIDDSVKTAEGIRIGDKLEKVIDTYKDEKVYLSTDNYYQYIKGNCILTFDYRNDVITGIIYYYMENTSETEHGSTETIG